MSDEAADELARRRTAGRDRWIKIVFAAVALVAVVFIYRRQTSAVGLDWPQGPEELEEALARAAADKRPVLVFFRRTKPGDATRRLIRGPLRRPENRRAIDAGGFLRVQVAIGKVAKSPLVRKYRLREFPTMLVLGPNGWEYNRREGYIGEVDFRDGFLDCRVIQHPGVVGWRNVSSPADMAGVLAEAKGRGRSILVLFAPPKPDATTKRLYQTTLADRANRRAIEQANLILVHAPVADVRKSALARAYGIEKLPAMLLLGPDGRPRRLRAGAIPKDLFAVDFLDVPAARSRR